MKFEAWYYRAALEGLWDSNVEGALFWAYIPGGKPPGGMHSVVNPDLTWRECAYIIREYYQLEMDDA